MKEIIKTFGVFLVVAVVACGLVLPQSASAALPAPNFMPGFPMLAGPQVIIMWGPVPGAVKYNVYMNGTKIGESPAMQVINPAPTAGGEYKYQVTAVDAAGAESPLSVEKVIKIILVSPPKGFVTLPALDRITFRWQASEGAVIYDVFRRKKGENDWKLLASITDTRYDERSADQGVDYEYAVKAKDSSGKSSGYSELVSAALLVPEAADIVEKKRIAHAHKLPTTFIDRVEIEHQPTDADTYENTMVVAAQNLLFFDDISDKGTIQEPQILLPDTLGFMGVHFSEDGELIYANNRKNKSLMVIDPYASTDKGPGVVLETYPIPAPPLGTPEDEGTLYLDLGAGKVTQMRAPAQPFDVVPDLDGNFVVSDLGNNRMIRLDSEGEFLGTVGYQSGKEIGTAPNWAITNPQWIDMSPEGTIYTGAVNSLTGFDADDTLLPFVGGAGQNFGTFANANGVFFDKRGNLWVTDMRNGTIQLFREQPELGLWPVYMITNDDKTGNPKTQTPIQTVVTYDGNHMVIVESMSKSLGWFKVLWDKADALEEGIQ